MTIKKPCHRSIALLLLMLCLAAQGAFPNARAYDAELLKDLPGEWRFLADATAEADDVRLEDWAFLILKEDGSVSLRCNNRDGTYAYSCEGTWAFEYLPDALDRLTLWFTATDDPAQAGVAYDVKCVYDFYMESWVENDTEITYLLCTPNSISGISPFEALYGSDNADFHKEIGPNMRVVHCKEYVSLREMRSTSAKRLAKVPSERWCWPIRNMARKTDLSTAYIRGRKAISWRSIWNQWKQKSVKANPPATSCRC